MKIIALDFESFGIEPRPKYPPKPVGIAIYDGLEAHYLAFGHTTENNTTEEYAKNTTRFLLDTADIILFHNAPFDCAILSERWELAVPWYKVRCTMVMAFLDNPHGELSLKPLAEIHLGLPPSEQDAVKAWLIKHGVVRANQKDWGAYIAYAPGSLVGEYAIGDVERTYDLYKFYMERHNARTLYA